MSHSIDDYDHDNLEEIINNTDLEHIQDSHYNIDDLLNEEDEDLIASPVKRADKGSSHKNSKKGKNKLQNYQGWHALDIIEKEEREISAFEYPNLESKFVLTNFQLKDHKKTSNISYNQLETINSYIFPLQEERGHGLGNARALAIAAGRYIIIGTHFCLACVFEYNQTRIRKFGSTKEQEYGPISSMDVDSERDTLICGYEKGQLVLWDLTSGSQLKTVPGLHDSKIIAVKFWKEGKSNIISSDANGNVLLLQINKFFLGYTVDKSVLLDKSAGPISNITILRKELARNSHLRNSTLAALSSHLMILVVTLEPIVGVVYKVERHSYIPPNSIPICSWGCGAICENESNTDPLFAMAWGNMLQLFQVNNVHEEGSKGFRPAGYFKSEYQIVFIGFLSRNLLALIDINKEVKVLYTGYFLPGEYDPKSSELDKKAILDTQLVDPDISFQVLRNNGEPNRFFYTNTVATIDATRRIFILANKSMYIGRLSTWEEHIKLLVSKGEWLAALAVCLEIYKGTNKMFAEVPNGEKERKRIMKPFFNELISNYIDHVGALHSNRERGNFISNLDEIWETVILTTIDFLVSSENFHYLFIEILKEFEKHKQGENFIRNLEPFILHNKITYIPNEPFREIVGFYSDRGRSKVLEHLIINLDIKSIDVGFTITLCMEHELLTALLYICTHSDPPDYLTPLVKLFAIYKTKIDRARANEALKSSDTHEETEELNEAKTAGYRCLWYIRLNFQARKFPQGTIDYDEWQVVIKNFVVWIFAEEILRILLSIDPAVCFELLGMLFGGEIAKVLEEEHSEIVAKEKSDKVFLLYPANEGQSEKYATIFDKSRAQNCSKIHLQMLEFLYSCTITEEALKYDMAMFIGTIVAEQQNLPIKSKTCKEIIEIILSDKNDKRGKGKGREEFDEESEEWLNKIESRGQMLLKLIDNCVSILSKEEIDSIFLLAEQSPYLELKRYLIEIKGDYKECFEFYMKQPSSVQRKNLFAWLKGVLPKLKESKRQQFNIMKDLVLSRLKEMVAIDSEKTREVLSEMDKSLEASAIRHLEPFPNLQLSYLEKILNKRGQDEHVDDDLLILNIALLCQLEPKRVIIELKHFDYPLDACLKLCRQYNVNDACAFLLERSGSIHEALDLYLIMFKKTLENKIKKMEKGEHFDEKSLQTKLQAALQICVKNNKRDDPDSEKLWFLLLDKILEFYKNFVISRPKSDKNRELADLYSEFIGTIFDEMTRNVALDSILEKIQRSYGDVRLGDLRKSFLSMLSNYHYEADIMENARTLIMDDLTDLTLRSNMGSTQGIDIEKLRLDMEIIGQIVVFPCSHTFPKNYILPVQDLKGDVYECPICAREDDQKILKTCWHFKPGVTAPAPKSKTPTIVGDPRVLNRESSASTIDTRLTQSQTSMSYELSPQMKLSKADMKDQMLRKMKLFDQKKEDEAHHLDRFKQMFEF